MHLRAVAAAARIGASLEPFATETLLVVRGENGLLHFDTECTNIVGGETAQIRLDHVGVHRMCPGCIRPYRFPERVERYGEAIEQLQRARFMTREDHGNGVAAMRAVQQAHAACRRAVRLVDGTAGGAALDVERCVASIKRSAVLHTELEAVEAYLDWAASLGVSTESQFPTLRRSDEERWQGRVEHARGELRMHGWNAFSEAVHAEAAEIESYRSAIAATRAGGTHVLCAIHDGEDEGDLVLWAGAVHRLERAGVLYAIVPDWCTDAARLLGAWFEVIGSVRADEHELMEVYAELARTRPGSMSLDAARRLIRGRKR